MTLSRLQWRRIATTSLFATIAVVVYAWIDLSYSLPWHPHRPNLPTFAAAPLANACAGLETTDAASSSAASSSAAPDAPIPNLVHYIWLLADPTVFSLDFKVFISVYSSYLFLRPDKIYFHTDVSPELWEQSKTAGDVWTQRVLAVPGVTPKYITNPTVTTKGVPIDTFGAKSDFIRADALREFGGVYLDVDAVPLRDLAPLRRAGFASVVGGATALEPKHTGYVNTGVWLARPHSALVEVFREAMDAYYNGVWAISVEILTDLAYRLHAIPGEVLIMNPRAFAPASFELDDQFRLFQPHPDGSSSSADSLVGLENAAHQPVGKGKELGAIQFKDRPLHETCVDALTWLGERERAGRMETWEMDFSATYVLHAFDDDSHRVKGFDGKITLPYVLARQSNYARAVYPAIFHALQEGILPAEEVNLA